MTLTVDALNRAHWQTVLRINTIVGGKLWVRQCVEFPAIVVQDRQLPEGSKTRTFGVGGLPDDFDSIEAVVDAFNADEAEAVPA